MKYLRKALACILVLTLCFSIFTITANAVTVVGSFLASKLPWHINSSGSGSVTLSANANKIGYIVMPDTSMSHSSSISLVN